MKPLRKGAAVPALFWSRPAPVARAVQRNLLGPTNLQVQSVANMPPPLTIRQILSQLPCWNVENKKLSKILGGLLPNAPDEHRSLKR